MTLGMIVSREKCNNGGLLVSLKKGSQGLIIIDIYLYVCTYVLSLCESICFVAGGKFECQSSKHTVPMDQVTS